MISQNQALPQYMAYVYNVKQSRSQGAEKNSVASNVLKSITNHQKIEDPIKR